MGIRKHLDAPKTPRRSVRQKQRAWSNSYSPSACRKPRSPMTPTKRGAAHRDHLPIVDTPTRAMIQGARIFARSRGIIGATEDIFRLFGVKSRTAYNILQQSARTGQNNIKKRGRPNKMTGEEVAAADSLLEDASLGMEAKGLAWIGIKGNWIWTYIHTLFNARFEAPKIGADTTRLSNQR
jgi:hypothetical protein